MSSYRLEKIRRICYNSYGSLIKFLDPELLYKKPLYRFLSLPETDQSILILCKGNICRSPYAGARLQAVLCSAGLSHISIITAGLETQAGKPADAQAIVAARSRGVDLETHRTRIAAADEIRSAGLILVMDPQHLRVLRTAYRDLKALPVLFGAFAVERNFPLVIEDPYGEHDSVFDERFLQIDAAAEGLVQAMLRLRSETGG